MTDMTKRLKIMKSFSLVASFLLTMVADSDGFCFSSKYAMTRTLLRHEPRHRTSSPLYYPYQTSSSSSSQVATTSSTKDTESTKMDRVRWVLRRAAYAFCVFAIGYRAGMTRNAGRVALTGSDIVSTATTATAPMLRRFPIVTTAAIFIILRDVWRSIPSWLRPSLLPRRRTQQEKLQKAVQKNPDDLSDVGTIAVKLQTVFASMQSKLVQPDETKKVDAFGPFLATMQLLQQYRERKFDGRSKLYQAAGRPGTKEDLKELAEYLEMADWAYDEDPRGTLRENLQGIGFSLLRHDKTVLPGYVGHFVAISKERKLAVIGVKGTSSFEDMLTDCCGTAVTHTLDEPYIRNGKKELRCHEGILISSKRLAEDLQPFVEELIVPSGYKILLVGHSLGAATASLVSVLLKSRIPSLRWDEEGSKLRVLAYASPPVFDYDNAKACSPFITTIVNNSDIITRASMANLAIMWELMKETNAKLEEKGLVDPMTGRSTRALIRKLTEGTKGDLLMEPHEYSEVISKALARVELVDPDHLYVPGKAVILYDRWENAKSEEGGGREEEEEAAIEAKMEIVDEGEKDDFGDILFDYGRPAETIALADDGTAEILRTIELGDRMLADHMVKAYRASIKTILDAETNE